MHRKCSVNKLRRRSECAILSDVAIVVVLVVKRIPKVGRKNFDKNVRSKLIVPVVVVPQLPAAEASVNHQAGKRPPAERPSAEFTSATMPMPGFYAVSSVGTSKIEYPLKKSQKTATIKARAEGRPLWRYVSTFAPTSLVRPDNTSMVS